jgi:hypothetical protein
MIDLEMNGFMRLASLVPLSLLLVEETSIRSNRV